MDEVVRENFLTGAQQRISQSTLERVRRRVAFEVCADALLRWRMFTFYAGVGGAVRADKIEQIVLSGGEFTSNEQNQWLVRPVMTLGLLDKILDLNVNVFFREAPEVRFGIGVSTSR